MSKPDPEPSAPTLPRLVPSPVSTLPRLVSSPVSTLPRLVPSPVSTLPCLVPSPVSILPRLVPSPRSPSGVGGATYRQCCHQTATAINSDPDPTPLGRVELRVGAVNMTQKYPAGRHLTVRSFNPAPGHGRNFGAHAQKHARGGDKNGETC